MSIVHITWFATFAAGMVSGCKPSTRATPTPAPAVQSPATQEAATPPAQAAPPAPKAAPTEDAKVAPKPRTAEPPPPPEGMVYVPGGTVHIGEPQNEDVHVSPFFIDRTEVTVEAYLKCINARACEPPYPQPGCNSASKKPRLKHPMNCLNKERAERYCTEQHKRLPSEAEWQAAAGGTDGRIFPWGNDAAGEQLCWQNSSKSPDNGTCPVGSFPQGASPFGALDMAGNVEEWTSTEDLESMGAFRMKGGSFLVDDMNPDASNESIGERIASGETRYDPATGVRCAKDL